MIISSPGVADGSITTSKLANGAVTSSKLATGAVINTSLAAGAVNNAAMASAAVQSVNLALQAVLNSLGAAGSFSTGSFTDGPLASTPVGHACIAIGNMSLRNNTASAVTADVQLWDGTTVAVSTQVTLAAGEQKQVTQAAYITNPAAAVRQSVKAGTGSGVIDNNFSGGGQDTTIFAIQLG